MTWLGTLVLSIETPLDELGASMTCV